MVDAGTAHKKHYKVGDSIQILTLGRKRAYQVTGIATFGKVDSLGGATMAIFDLRTAQALLHKEGRFDEISIAPKAGTSPSQLVRAVQPLVPDSLQVRNSEKEAQAKAKETNQRLRPLLPARLRRHPAVRRCLRHLQHALDHRRPAHT